MMTAREKAIEAAAEVERNYAVDLCGPDVALPRWDEMTERMRDNYRGDAGRYYDSLAPHIESALLDRLLSEDAVQAAAKNRFIAESGTEGMWNRLGPKAKNTHYRLARAALTAAVAEIREGK